MGSQVGRAGLPGCASGCVMILLDTHVVIWAVIADPHLGEQARAAIRQDRDRRISAMVAWEVAMLARKRRLAFSIPVETWLDRAMIALEARDVPVSREIAQEAGGLPDDVHGDPGDRIMVATARQTGAMLITADRKILAYAAAGHLNAIDARA